MSGIPSAGTDLSREILDKALGEHGKPGSGLQPPSTTFAEQIQDAIDQGADLDWIQRRFHLSDTELRDYCADIMDDGFDEDWSGSTSGY